MESNDHRRVDFSNHKVPGIALGTEIPHKIEREIEKKERARKAEKKDKLHFWVSILMDIICLIVGWLLGKYC